MSIEGSSDHLTHPTCWRTLGHDDGEELALLNRPLEEVLDAA